MPLQHFEILDYFGPIFVGISFAIILSLLSLIGNFILIRRTDEITAFEKLGAKYNLRVGPHRVSLVKSTMTTHIDENGQQY